MTSELVCIIAIDQEHIHMDRAAMNQALAKALAYKQCGKHSEAAKWANELVRLLKLAINT